jgi:hypothetical protein
LATLVAKYVLNCGELPSIMIGLPQLTHSTTDGGEHVAACRRPGSPPAPQLQRRAAA